MAAQARAPATTRRTTTIHPPRARIGQASRQLTHHSHQAHHSANGSQGNSHHRIATIASSIGPSSVMVVISLCEMLPHAEREAHDEAASRGARWLRLCNDDTVGTATGA